VESERLSIATRFTLGVGLGFMLATLQAQDVDTASGLAVLVLWPTLFCLGLAGAIVGGRFVPRPEWMSRRTFEGAAVALAVAMAAAPYVRGYFYLREIGAEKIAVIGGAKAVGWEYHSPLLPRMVVLKLRTDRTPQELFDYYALEYVTRGWTPESSAPPLMGSWRDHARNSVTLLMYAGNPGLAVTVIWNRH
jgi:hypothetical protein